MHLENIMIFLHLVSLDYANIVVHPPLCDHYCRQKNVYIICSNGENIMKFINIYIYSFGPAKNIR